MRDTSANFLNYLIGDLIFPLEEQDHYGEGKDFWCLDWWIVEVAKYFHEGEHAYMRYPIARRLTGNTSLNKEEIRESARSRIREMEAMKTYAFDHVAVLETCRGFDTVLTKMVKKWEKVYVVIRSEYPAVIEKTKSYLKKYDDVEIIGHFGLLGDPFYRMIPDGFDYRAVKVEG